MSRIKNNAGKGQVIVHRHKSSVLKGNPLKDPIERDIYVYLPPGDPPGPKRPLPALCALAAFAGDGAEMFNKDPFGESLAERMDRLIASEECCPVIVVAPNCFNRLGGSQYINSSAVGQYEDYLVKEVVPFINKIYSPKRWGVFGKSSGGYGALIMGMHHPDLFQAVASHAGDSNFELCYLPDIPSALDAFRASGSAEEWVKRFWDEDVPKRKSLIKPLMVLAMAAHYSPNVDSSDLGIEFPFDMETGRFKPEIWKKWRAWDPVNLVASHKKELKSLLYLYLDCGNSDEYAMHWGTRALVNELQQFGIKPHYETFDGGHRGLDFRYDTSLPILAKALS